MAGSCTAEGAMFLAVPGGDLVDNPELLDTVTDEVWAAEGPMRVLWRSWELAGADWEPCDTHVVEQVKQFYFDGEINADKLQNYTNMVTDSIITRGSHASLLGLLGHGAPVWEYSLSFQVEKLKPSTYQ